MTTAYKTRLYHACADVSGNSTIIVGPDDAGNRLDALRGVLYIRASIRRQRVNRKGIRERVMQYFGYFAFTYRFSFRGERAGETHAGNQGS